MAGDVELKKHFEANMLDGDEIQAGQMLSSASVFEYLAEVVAEREKVFQKKLSTAQKIMSKSKKSQSGCVEWEGHVNKYGYGILSYTDSDFKSDKVHRVAYYIFEGIDPGNLTIDHLCNNPKCINTKHMVLVTRSMNTMRGRRDPNKINYCDAGHKLDGDNLRMRWSGSGSNKHRIRGCMTCKRANDARYRAKKRYLNQSQDKETK